MNKLPKMPHIWNKAQLYLYLVDGDPPEDENADHGHHNHDQDVVELKVNNISNFIHYC